MWITVVIIVLFVLSTAQGLRKGFVATVLETVGWALALVMGFVWQGRAKALLIANTDLPKTIETAVASRIHLEGLEDGILSKLPLLLQQRVDNVVSDSISSLTESISGFLSELFLSILAFVAVVLVVKLVLWIIGLFFSKKKKDGLLGVLDSLLGLAVGLVRGVLLVYLFLALLVPLSTLLGSAEITGALTSSNVASTLYDNNPLLLLLGDLF